MSRRDRSRAAVVVALVAAALVGCTDDGGADDGPAAPAAGIDAGPVAVPAPFARRPPASGAWAFVGATADALVGFGGEPDGADGFGQAVDLATGEVVGIGPPPSVRGRTVTPTDAAFGEEAVLVAGFVAPEDGYPPGTDRAAPVEAVALRLDPLAGTWTEVAAPDVTPGIGLFANLRPLGPDGGAAGWLSTGGYSSVAVVTFDGERWATVLDTDQGDTRAAALGCSTSTSAWAPGMDERGAWDGVVAFDLADGAERSIAVPGLEAPSLEAVVVTCSAGAVLVAQRLGDDLLVRVSTDDGRSWAQADVAGADAGPVRLEQEHHDGGRGAVLRARDDDGRDASIVLTDDGRVVPLDVDDLSTPVVWRGTSGALLAIEPDGDDGALAREVALP